MNSGLNWKAEKGNTTTMTSKTLFHLIAMNEDIQNLIRRELFEATALKKYMWWALQTSQEYFWHTRELIWKMLSKIHRINLLKSSIEITFEDTKNDSIPKSLF